MTARRPTADLRALTRRALEATEDWYSKLPRFKSKMPARGTIAASLVILERLKRNYDLRLEAHRAKGQGQLTGVSSAAVQRILLSHGETRPFLAEGGRTNRGGPGDIGTMLDRLQACQLEPLSERERESVLSVLQGFLVSKVQEYHARERLRPHFDPAKTAWDFVNEILALAQAEGKHAAVAQYLIGAKLEARFPDLEIRNESFSTADQQTRQRGDFHLGDTVFHVTVHPNPAHYDKCRDNLREGLKPYLVVPYAIVHGVKQLGDELEPGRITVTSLESFVSQNLDELSAFKGDKLMTGLKRLLEIYNRRVDEVETDKSLLIEMPGNL